VAEGLIPAPKQENWLLDPSKAIPALLESFLRGKKKATLRAYSQGLEVFRQFVGETTTERAAALLFSKPHGLANKIALDFKSWLMEKKLAAATVNLRLASLRSLVDLGRRIGVVPWSLEVDSLPEEKYRDTKGPGLEKVVERIKALRAAGTPMASRDAAVITLMGTMGLRRGEVVGLDLSDWNGSVLMILGKARTAKEPLSIPEGAQKVLREWLFHRGNASGPLFYHFGKGKMHAERLSDRSVGRITNRLELGHAHGVRHSAITKALDDSKGDVRKVAKFSRHKNIQTLLRYDDNRKDMAGEVAGDLAKGLE
jgi:integrase/recombinase XerC